MRTLLACHKATPAGTLASERCEQDIIRFVNVTLEGREEAWETDLDDVLDQMART